MSMGQIPLRNSSLGVEPEALASQIVTILGSSSYLWVAGLIFLRIGAVLLILPGISDQNVPARIRLGFALALSFMLTPLLSKTLPALPSSMALMVGIIFQELLIGLIMGTLMRIFINAMGIAGELISLQTTLSFAQTTNPGQTQGSTTIATFLAILGLTLVYATGTHHLFFRGIVDSYALFAPQKPIMWHDGLRVFIQSLSGAFSLGVQLSAPVLVFGLIVNIASGFIGRLMPAFPIFFATTPILVLGGLSLMAIGLGGVGIIFIDHYQDQLALLIRRGP
jgi:flagellar biosynthetic protein FliR